MKPNCPTCESNEDVIAFTAMPMDAESLRMYWCACGAVGSEDVEYPGSLEWGQRKQG